MGLSNFHFHFRSQNSLGPERLLLHQESHAQFGSFSLGTSPLALAAYNGTASKSQNNERCAQRGVFRGSSMRHNPDPRGDSVSLGVSIALPCLGEGGCPPAGVQ